MAAKESETLSIPKGLDKDSPHGRVHKLGSRPAGLRATTNPLARLRRIGPQVGYAGGASARVVLIRVAPVTS